MSEPERRLPAYCSHGHAFDEENTAYRANGWRYCKTCNRERSRRNTARKRDCLYPENTPQTAYKKGCRCDECFDVKAAIDRRRSRPSPCHRCGGPKEIGGWYCDDCSWLVLVDKVTSKIEMGANGCWIFTGTKTQGGYGVLSAHRGGHGGVAHRIMYEHFVGPINGGFQLDHLCRVPACCNPDHLEVVTPAENLRRAHVARRVEREAIDAELQRLRDGIEDYLLWEPGRRGHVEAHRKLAELVRDSQPISPVIACRIDESGGYA